MPAPDYQPEFRTIEIRVDVERFNIAAPTAVSRSWSVWRSIDGQYRRVGELLRVAPRRWVARNVAGNLWDGDNAGMQAAIDAASAAGLWVNT